MLLVTIKYQTKVIRKWTGREPSNRESMNIYVQSKKKKHLLSWHFVAPPMHACNSRAKIGWCFGNEANAMQVNQSTRRRKTWNWYTEHWKLIILGRNHGLIAWEKNPSLPLYKIRTFWRPKMNRQKISIFWQKLWVTQERIKLYSRLVNPFGKILITRLYKTDVFCGLEILVFYLKRRQA